MKRATTQGAFVERRIVERPSDVFEIAFHKTLQLKVMRKKYTGEKAGHRKKKQAERRSHIQAILDNKVKEELPEALLPEVFSDIQEIYWDRLTSVPDPRSPHNRVYPLHLILHRVISGFVDGTRHIGVLFPKKRAHVEPGKKKLGALPTRKAVYTLLRRIDWEKANEILAPLWDRLGYTPNLTVRRKLRDPKTILDEFRERQDRAEVERRKKISEEQKARERAEGMSAAKAKRGGRSREKTSEQDAPERTDPVECLNAPPPAAIQHDLVIDGKVVKSSYNSGAKERFVHVTEIRADEDDDRSRFIIGARPTELDRNGEWGAALSILDALTPLAGDRAVVVSGDAGFCVEQFCEWLNANGFFLPLPDKEKRRQHPFESRGLGRGSDRTRSPGRLPSGLPTRRRRDSRPDPVETARPATRRVSRNPGGFRGRKDQPGDGGNGSTAFHH